MTLRVTATGVGPLSYQWQFTNAPIVGATNATLKLPNVQFTNAGNYSVLVSDAVGATPSAPASLTVTPFGSTLKQLTISNVVDMVCDPIRGRVYISANDSVLRYDLATDTFLSPWQLGGIPWGLDLSLAGNTLAVANRAETETNLWIHLINLTNDIVQQVSFEKTWFFDTGATAVAFGNDGAVYITSPDPNGGPGMLRRYDPATTNTSSMGIGSYELLAPSGDGSTIGVGQTHGSPSSFYRFDVATQTFPWWARSPSYFTEFLAANRDGSQFADVTYGGTYLFNGNGALINVFGGPVGAIYHPTADLLFCAWSSTREVWALNPITLAVAARYDFGYAFGGFAQLTRSYGPNRLRISRDGSVVLVKTTSGVNFLRLTNAAPMMATQPTNFTTFLSNSASFFVEAIGPGPFRYQWRYNGEEIENATNATLTLPQAFYLEVGTYSVAVLNPFGFVISSNATLTLNGPPFISQQPQALDIATGDTLMLSVGVLGTAPFQYQWRKDGAPIAGAASLMFVVTSAHFTNQGSYTVVVTNQYGASTSAVAVVTVDSPPYFITPLSDQTVDQGGLALLTASASGSPPLSYQWRFNGTNLPGATSATLGLTNVWHTNAGLYSVVVTNVFGTVASSNAVLTVNWPPELTLGPTSQTAPAGTNVSFAAAAVGLPVRYQWLFAGNSISGATNPVLNLVNVQATNQGDYAIIVFNHLGTTQSPPATLTVTPAAPRITTQPLSQAIPAGSNVTFTVSAAGTEPFGYQWQFETVDLPGRTASTLTVTNVQAVHAGSYTVLVTNAAGQVLSDPAVLTVTPTAPIITTQPQGVTATKGAEIQLQVAAMGSEPFRYQWQLNDFDLPAATNALLFFTNTQAADAGNYTVVVTNDYGAVTSAIATVTLTPPPGFLWARKGGSQFNEVGSAVVVDKAGNIYVAGDFSFSANIGGSNLVSSGGLDIYVAKYNPAGQLLWARKAGGIYDDSPNALALDSSGNLYVVGYFKSAIINFDGTTANNITPGGASDAFIAQYDPDGNVLWVRGFGGAGNDEAKSVACDAAGNVILCGSFSIQMYFGTNLLTSAGNTDVFIGKFTPTRDVAWVKRAGGTSSEAALTLTTDAAGNILVGGTFFMNMDFGNGVTVSSVTVNEGELFLTKFASDGTALWARKATGLLPQVPTRLATDSSGNVFMVGYFGGTTVFDTLSATASGNDSFLAKYDPAGTIQWLRNAADAAYGLALDEGGTIYLSGQFASPTSFGTNTLTTSGGNDVFVAAYTGSGAVLWARKAGGSGSDLARDLALDHQGNAYVVGTFSSSPATFGHVSLNASSSDMFLAKLATVDPAALPVFTSQPSNQTAVAGVDIVLASSYSGPQPIARQWWFNGSVLEGATNATLVLSNATSALAGGYFLVLSNLNGMATSAVVSISVATESDFVWARRGGGASNDVALASVADAFGNVYVAGYFTDTADFGGVNLVSAGGEDIFVARYNPLGTLLWVQQFGGPGNDRATALCREVTGGIAIAGNFSDSVAFDTNTLVSAGGTDVFLARLTGAGGLNWVRRGGGASNDVAQAVAAHSVSPGIYVAGFAQANATFGTTTLTISGTTNKMFLAKYDTSGNFVWAATTANTGPSEGRALACDAGNYVYLGGTRAGSVSFGGLISTGAMSGFVARYSSAGNTASWVRWFGTPASSLAFNNRVNGLALDANSNIYVTGEFQGEAYLLGGTNGPISYNTNQADGFLLKLDPASTPQWVKTISGPGADAGNSVTLDPLGNPYVTGSFSTQAAIGNTLLTSAGGQDMFVALFDTTGTLVKARRAGGAADDIGKAVATDGAGRVFVTGGHAAPAAFGTNSVTTAAGSDAFLTRLDFFGAQTPPQITTQPQSQSVKLGSNVVLNVGAISGLPVTFRWRLNGVNLNGATSNSFRLNNTQLANLGDYSVVVQNSAGVVTSQVATVAQEFTPDYWWLRRTGSSGDDQALAVAVDATNDAVYVAGLFSGTNPGLSNLVSSGGTDAFLARYDRNGNLIWARRAGGTSADAVQAVTVDPVGNILVGGYFYSSTVAIGSFTLTNRSLPTASFSDLFLAKYDAAGNVLWARRAGGTSNPNILNRSDVATALVTDGAANVYLTGSFHSVADFGTLQLTNLNSTNFFLAKYDEAGNIQWARTTIGTNTSQGNGLCVDTATNVYVTGSFLGSLNLGGGLLTNANNPFLNSSAFVAKYDRDGTLQWARKTPGTAGVGQAVVVDAMGSLYATSYKRDYGNGLLLAKYDSAGTPLWQRSAAISCCTGDYTSAAGLAVDRFGNPIVVGYGNGSIEGITNSFTGGYVLKYRSDGSGFWMLRCASLAASGTGPAAVALDDDDNSYIVGRFTGTSFFGATSNLVSVGNNDMFLAKLGLLPPAMVGAMTNRLVVAGSNATLQAVGVVGSGNLSYQWQLNGTNLVGATNAMLALNNFTYDRAGRYAVVISNQVGVATGQVAGVGFVPVLKIAAAPGAAVLDWSGLFTLQAAAQATGPYVDVAPVTSPFTNLIGSGAPQRYFRLRVPSPDVSGNWEAGGFNVSLLGSPGRRYVVDVSTNLVNWTPVVTNYFPFKFQETNPVVAPQKFYRARLLP